MMTGGDTVLFGCDDRMKRWLVKQCEKELTDMLARCAAAEKAAKQAIILKQMED